MTGSSAGSGQAIPLADFGPTGSGQGAPPPAVRPPPSPATAIGAGVVAAPSLQAGVLGDVHPGLAIGVATPETPASASVPAVAGAPSALGQGIDAGAEEDADEEPRRPGDEDEANSAIYGAEYEANLADARSIWKDVPVQTVARPSGAGMASSDAQWSNGLARALRVVGPANFGQTPEDGTADSAGAAFQTVLRGAKFNSTSGGTPQWFSSTPGQSNADRAFTLLTGEPPAYNENGVASGQTNLGNGMIANITAYRARSTQGPSIQFNIKQTIVFRGADGRALSQPKDIISGKVRF